MKDSIRLKLDLWGFSSYADYLYTVAEICFLEGLIPVIDAGVLTPTELKKLHITSVDNSEQILAIAARNIHSYKNLLAPRNNRLDLVQSDLFSAIDFPAKLDFIVSNPPYIPSDKIADLQTEVSQFEPRNALDGGKDGLFFYRYLLGTTPGMLKSDGKMILEIGFDQQPDLNKLHNKFPAWKSSNFLPDLHENVRVWILGKEPNLPLK